ncbi:MAG: hypothetical protein Tsb0021_11130 [Chlamydiales bacterium]
MHYISSAFSSGVQFLKHNKVEIGYTLLITSTSDIANAYDVTSRTDREAKRILSEENCDFANYLKGKFPQKDENLEREALEAHKELETKAIDDLAKIEPEFVHFHELLSTSVNDHDRSILKTKLFLRALKIAPVFYFGVTMTPVIWTIGATAYTVILLTPLVSKCCVVLSQAQGRPSAWLEKADQWIETASEYVHFSLALLTGISNPLSLTYLAKSLAPHFAYYTAMKIASLVSKQPNPPFIQGMVLYFACKEKLFTHHEISSGLVATKIFLDLWASRADLKTQKLQELQKIGFGIKPLESPTHEDEIKEAKIINARNWFGEIVLDQVQTTISSYPKMHDYQWLFQAFYDIESRLDQLNGNDIDHSQKSQLIKEALGAIKTVVKDMPHKCAGSHKDWLLHYLLRRAIKIREHTDQDFECQLDDTTRIDELRRLGCLLLPLAQQKISNA